MAGHLVAASQADTIDLLGRSPNVLLTGPLGYDETQRQIARHRLVVNTSPSEGFSNAMLEGWALARPAVTLHVNPNGLLDGDRLGVCAGADLVSMAAAIVALLEPGRGRPSGSAPRTTCGRRTAPTASARCFQGLVAG